MQFSEINHIPKRVLITGADGMLGKAFKKQFSLRFPQIEMLAEGRGRLDVTDWGSFAEALKWLGDGTLVHCAALVNVEACENDYSKAKSIILEPVQRILENQKKFANFSFFLPQSFLIFDGSMCPIVEDTIPNPLSNYGRLKLQSEDLIRHSEIDHLIVRMGGFFGGEESDKNFVGKIITSISRAIQEGKQTYEVGDRVWQPTWTDDLALNSIQLILASRAGVYNMACQGEASFFDVALEIAKHLGWSELIEIKKVSSEFFDKKEGRTRPAKAILDCGKLMREKLYIQRSWHESLEDYLRDPFFDQFKQIKPGARK